MSEQTKIMEAYKSMVSEMRGATAGRRQSRTFPLNKQSEADAFAKKHGGKVEKKGATLYVTWDVKEAKEECPKCEGKGCDHCDNTGYHEVSEASCGTKNKKEALDPVNDKENDKKFKDRKDKDIDNDGDVDSSDEYLHKRRAATDDAIDAKKDKKKKPAGNSGEKTPEISKIGEKVTTKEDVDALLAAVEEAVNQKKGATEPEKMDSKASPKEKEFVAKHAIDKKDHEDMEKVEEPKERKVKKEMTEFEVIRALLSGNPTGE